MVLNHLNLKSVEVATPSLRHWDLIGWDLDCYNREVSIGAIKHLGKKRHFEVTAQTSILKVCLSNLDWKYWSFESLFVQRMKIGNLILVRLRRVLFCHHCPGRPEREYSKTSRACRLLPRESDTGAIAKVPYRLLPRDSNCDWVRLLYAGNLNKKGLRVPGEGQAQFAVCWKQPMPSTILANKEGWKFLILV